MVSKPTVWFKFLLLISVTVFLYFPSFRYGFFQDDWLHLLNTQGPISDLVKFFSDNSAIYYRPLGIQLAYWLQQKIFGLEPVYWHGFSLLIHLLNTGLVYALIAKITRNKAVSFLASFLYATAAIHFISLFWLAETNLLLGALVLFLTLNVYLSDRLTLSLILFALGLLTHEIVIIFPALVFLLRRPPKAYFIGLLGLSLGYMLLRFYILPIPATGTYTLQFNLSSFNSLIWYVLWSFNLPEELKYQIVLWPPYIQPKFLVNFTPHLLIWWGSFVSLLAVIMLKTKPGRLIWLALGWFMIGISLFLILPLHQYPNYVIAGLPGMTLMLSLVLVKFNRFFRIVFLVFWLASSFVTLRITELTHWTVQEAQRVDRTLAQAKRQYPALPAGSVLVIKSDYQIEQALFDQLGLQFFYQNPNLTTYYGDFHNLMPESCKIIEQQQENVRPCLVEHGIYILD